jgi:hypothetical protein
VPVAETIENLFATIEHEQSALVTLIEEAVDDDSDDTPERVAGRQRKMEPVMKRLGDATRRLVVLAQREGVPRDLAPRIDAWREEITALMGAVQGQAEEVIDRRALIASTLQRLHHATQTISGYRQPKAPGARFVTKRA